MANTYRLEIVTPLGVVVDEQVESCIFRTTEGDVGILGGHTDYAAAIEVGEIKVKLEGKPYRSAVATDGFAHVSGDHTRILVSTFEWAEDIDAQRAERAKERSKQMLAAASTPEQTELAEFQLKKARVRLRVAKKA